MGSSKKNHYPKSNRYQGSGKYKKDLIFYFSRAPDSLPDKAPKTEPRTIETATAHNGLDAEAEVRSITEAPVNNA